MPRFGCFDHLISSLLPWYVLKVLGGKAADIQIGMSADLLRYAWCDKSARLFAPSLSCGGMAIRGIWVEERGLFSGGVVGVRLTRSDMFFQVLTTISDSIIPILCKRPASDFIDIRMCDLCSSFDHDNPLSSKFKFQHLCAAASSGTSRAKTPARLFNLMYLESSRKIHDRYPQYPSARYLLAYSSTEGRV